MAYKFQLGAYTASGSLKQEGALECDTSLTIGSAAMTEADLEKLDGITNGTAAANKALVADANVDIASLRNIDGSGDLTMGTITMPGFTVDADGDTALKSLLVDNSSTIGCDADADLMTLSDGLVVVAGEMQVTTLDIGGTNISATAAEINYLDNDDLVAGDITKLAALTATAAEINLLDAVTRGSIIYGNGSGASAKLAKGSAHTFLQSDGTDISYVALSGDATLNAGALTIANDAVSLAKMAGLARGKFIVGDASGDPSALALGSAGQFLVSDNDDAVWRSLSGDATLAANGAITISAGAVENSMLADDAVGADELAANAVVNASVASNAAIAASKLDFNVDLGGDITFGSQSDDVVSFGGGVTVGGDLTVNGTTTSVNSTTINISSSFTFEGPADAHETTLHAGGDGTADAPAADTTLYLPALSAGNYYIPALADKATAASAAVTAAEFALLDGGSSVGTTALASGDGFLHNDAGTMKHTSINKLADFFASDGLTAASGKLEVSLNGLGASKTTVHQSDSIALVDSEGSDITKKITFSNFEDEIFGNISGDIAIAAGGAATIQAGAVEHGMLAEDIISGQAALGGASVAQADLLMLDDGPGTVKKVTFSNFEDSIFGNVSGDAAIAAGGALTIAADAVEGSMLNDNVISGQTELASGSAVDADEIMISDGGTLKKLGLDSLKVYMSDIAADVAVIAAAGTLAVGVNYFADMSADGEDAVTLPASAGMSVGQSVKLKAPSDCSAARYITVNRAGSQTIDGQTSIRLESPFAAVEMVYVAADTWRVF